MFTNGVGACNVMWNVSRMFRDVPEEGWFFLWLYCFTCFNLVIFRVALGEIIGPNHVRKVK